jgi:hypothetical protein
VQRPGDVVDRERGDPPPPEGCYEMAVELVAVRLERARVTLAGGDLRLEAFEPPPATVSKRSRGERGTLPWWVAAISASRSRRASATSNPIVRKRSLPAWRQQAAYLPFGWR